MTPASRIARPIPNQLLGQVRLYLGRSDADFDNAFVNSHLFEILKLFSMYPFSNNDFVRWSQCRCSGATVQFRRDVWK